MFAATSYRSHDDREHFFGQPSPTKNWPRGTTITPSHLIVFPGIVPSQFIIPPAQSHEEPTESNHLCCHLLQKPLQARAVFFRQRSPTKNWHGGTIFAATCYRIHNKSKPVQKLPSIVPRRTDREEQFLLPPCTKTTTIAFFFPPAKSHEKRAKRTTSRSQQTLRTIK